MLCRKLVAGLLLLLTCVHSLEFQCTNIKDESQNTRPVLKSQAVGGLGGGAFDDVVGLDIVNMMKVVGVSAVNISYGDKVNSLQVTYLQSNGSHVEGPVHGKVSGSNVSFTLGQGECIVKVEGQASHDSVYQLSFTTTWSKYTAKAYGPFGERPARLSFSFQNAYIVGFFGRADNLVNSVGVYSLPFLESSGLLGKAEGSVKFDDRADRRVPPIVGIKKMFVWHGDYIYAIQVEYILLGNTTLVTEKYGGSGGNLSTVQFDVGGTGLLQDIDVCASDKAIHGIGLYTTGSPHYLAFGNYSIGVCDIILTTSNSMILGFFGSFSNFLVNCGVYHADNEDLNPLNCV